MKYLSKITTEVFRMRRRVGLSNNTSQYQYWHLARHAYRCELVLDVQYLTDSASLDIDIFDGPDGESWTATNSTTSVTATGVTRIAVDTPFGPNLFFRGQVKSGKTAEFAGFAHWHLIEPPLYLVVEDLKGTGEVPLGRTLASRTIRPRKV